MKSYLLSDITTKLCVICPVLLGGGRLDTEYRKLFSEAWEGMQTTTALLRMILPLEGVHCEIFTVGLLQQYCVTAE